MLAALPLPWLVRRWVPADALDRDAALKAPVAAEFADLMGVRAALERGAEPVACLQFLSTIVRRFAMTSVARTAVEPEVAGMIGERWLRYLDGRWDRTDFSAGVGKRLLAAPYARPNSIERGTALELTALCTAWLSAQPATQRARRA